MTGVGPGVRRVGEQRAERDDGRHAELARRSSSSSSQNARQRMFGSIPCTSTTSPVGAGRPARPTAGWSATRSPGDPVDQPHRRPGDLEVVVVLGVDRGQRLGVPDQLEVLERAAGGVPGVVPALERGDRGPGRRASGSRRRRVSRSASDGRSSASVRLAWPTGTPCSAREAIRRSSGVPCRMCSDVTDRAVRLRLLDALASASSSPTGRWAPCCRPPTSTLDDFAGLEGCNEILNDTRPDVVADIHRAYFEAGADAVETNTFGANLPNLADYDIADRIRELAEKGAADRPRGGRRDAHGRTGRGSCSARSGPAPSCRRSGHAPYATAARRLRRVRPPACSTAAPTRSSSRPARTCCRSRPRSSAAQRAMAAAGRRVPIDRPRHRRDHRHDAARQRDRRRADRARAARHRPDRAELRHRSRRDERAPALPVPARPDRRCR